MGGQSESSPNYTSASDGTDEDSWMEGLVLMMLYLIIAVSFWYYPGSNTATLLGCGEAA